MGSKEKNKYLENLINRRHYLQFMALINMTESLIENGAQVNRVNEDGRTVRHSLYYCQDICRQYLFDQSEHIISGVKKGIYDLNYYLGSEEDSFRNENSKLAKESCEDSSDSMEAIDASVSLIHLTVGDAVQIPKNTTLLTELINSKFHIRDIVINLIKATKKPIITLGDENAEKLFFKRMFTVPEKKEGESQYDDELIKTFFGSSKYSVGPDLKRRAIDYYINGCLTKEQTQDFIDNILSLPTIKNEVRTFQQSLVYAICYNNRPLAEYFANNLNESIGTRPINISDESERRKGRYHECFAQLAYDTDMKDLSRKLFDMDTFNYGEPGVDINVIYSFFRDLMEKGDYNFGFDLISKFLKLNLKPETDQNRKGIANGFVHYAYVVIDNLKNVNISEIGKSFVSRLISINEELHDSEMENKINTLKEIYLNPERDNQHQCLIQALKAIVEPYADCSVEDKYFTVPGRAKKGPSIKPTTAEQ